MTGRGSGGGKRVDVLLRFPRQGRCDRSGLLGPETVRDFRALVFLRSGGDGERRNGWLQRDNRDNLVRQPPDGRRRDRVNAIVPSVQNERRAVDAHEPEQREQEDAEEQTFGVHQEDSRGPNGDRGNVGQSVVRNDGRVDGPLGSSSLVELSMTTGIVSRHLGER